jgi:type IV secretory pathway VirB2 component (pilin)
MPSPHQIALTVSTLVAAAYAAVVLAHADALRAAGVTGKAPPNAAAIEKFVSTLTDNALWIIGTVAVLAIVVIGGLFFFGHTRAPDLAIRVGIGALIIVSASGIAG